MTAIILGAVAASLGALCCWLVYVVHWRYRHVNARNDSILTAVMWRVRDLERRMDKVIPPVASDDDGS